MLFLFCAVLIDVALPKNFKTQHLRIMKLVAVPICYSFATEQFEIRNVEVSREKRNLVLYGVANNDCCYC